MRKFWAVLALVLVGLGIAAGSASAQGVTVFTVPLTPSGDPEQDGSGIAVLRVDPVTDEVCYNIVVRNIDQPTEPAPGIGSAHIHFVGTGGIAVDLDTQFLATGTDTYVAVGCVLGDSATLDNILNPELSGQFYINVHTAAAPGGAVQGALTA